MCLQWPIDKRRDIIMDIVTDEKQVNKKAVYAYTSVSLIAAALFFFFASLTGNSPVAIWGGAIWVFILSMIVTMPIFIPYTKKRHHM